METLSVLKVSIVYYYVSEIKKLGFSYSSSLRHQRSLNLALSLSRSSSDIELHPRDILCFQWLAPALPNPVSNLVKAKSPATPANSLSYYH